MTSLMHEELKEKIAKWLGWEFHSDGVHWRMSSGILGWSLLENLPNFPNDISACFERIEPKIKSLDCYWQINAGGPGCIASIRKRSEWRTGRTEYISEAETAALAFCLAVEKLIDASH